MEGPKTCPHCGENDRLMVHNQSKVHYVECLVCGARGPVNKEKDCHAGKVKAIADWDRRAALENKPLTNFNHITASPESLSKLLQAVNNGYIHFDNLYCHAQCGDDDILTISRSMAELCLARPQAARAPSPTMVTPTPIRSSM